MQRKSKSSMSTSTYNLAVESEDAVADLQDQLDSTSMTITISSPALAAVLQKHTELVMQNLFDLQVR